MAWDEKCKVTIQSIIAAGSALYRGCMQTAMDWISGVHPSTGVVVAAFDESGKLNDSAVVSFAGVALDQQKLDDFSKSWTEITRKAGASNFSMKDAMNLRGTFETWHDRIDDRDSLLLTLSKLAAEAFIVVAPMSTDDFKALPQTQREKLGGNPQYCGFEVSIKGLLREYPSRGIHLVCDLSEEYAEKCIRLYHRLRARDQDAKNRCFAITFADDRNTPHLQAADLVAYCSRANHMRSNRPVEPIVEQVIAILGLNRSSTNYFVYRAGGEGLGAGEFE